MSLANIAVDSVSNFSPRAWFSPKPSPVELVDEPLAEDLIEEAEVEPPILSAGAFAEEIDLAIKAEDRREIAATVMTIKPDEIHDLVRQAAKAKGLYLTALIEMSRKSHSNEAAQNELRRLRINYEELSLGLTRLRQMLLDQEIIVDGVS